MTVRRTVRARTLRRIGVRFFVGPISVGDSDVPLGEDECVAIGGHCYEIEPYILTSNPPRSRRVCKHCGKRQLSIPWSPKGEWQDD